MDKARTLDCDAVILDLEDSVAPQAKAGAREAAVAAVRGGFGPRPVVIRCNGLDTPWGQGDLAAAARAGPDAVLAPKVRSAADIAAWSEGLAAAPAHTRLWAMIETAQAMLSLAAIAARAQDTRLAGLVIGLNDLGLELRLKLDAARTAAQPLLSQLVVAARAHRLLALDAVFNRIGDGEGFEAECRQGAAFGFDGKTLVHPSQIEPCNRIFSPSSDELAWARAVVRAFAAPQAQGRGAIELEGRMVERLHLVEAQRMLGLQD